jgi:molybdenum cofactor synthesis domain-containing protein
MKSEIIVIGDELLIGQVLDTNSKWMATELNKQGWEVTRITTISDDAEDITEAISSAFSRVDVILMTGGLGPTSDDVTKPVLCRYFGGKMIFEAIKGEYECECCESKLNLKELVALAIATSIDALAVGVAFALEYERNTVFVAVALIGVITAGLSAIGVFIGHKFGAKYKNKAEFAGGLVLVIIGLKFLLEGLNIIGG